MRKRTYGQYVKRARRRTAAGLPRALLRGRRALSRYRRGYTRTGGFYGRFFPGSPELKFLDTSISGTIDATAELAPGGGTTTGLCLIPQGVTESTRVGRKCTITSIQAQCQLELGTGVASSSYMIALVWDKQANGAYPAFTDIFSAATINPHLNLSNSSRFVVLKRWNGVMNNLTYNDTGAVWGSVRKAFKMYKKCKIPLEFSSTTGAITELKSNNLVVAWVATGDDVITASLNFRVRFSDD